MTGGQTRGCSEVYQTLRLKSKRMDGWMGGWVDGWSGRVVEWLIGRVVERNDTIAGPAN